MDLLNAETSPTFRIRPIKIWHGGPLWRNYFLLIRHWHCLCCFSLDKLTNKRYRLMVICIAMRPVSRQMSLLNETHWDHVVLADVKCSKPWYQYRINRVCVGLAEARNDMQRVTYGAIYRNFEQSSRCFCRIQIWYMSVNSTREPGAIKSPRGKFAEESKTQQCTARLNRHLLGYRSPRIRPRD